MPASQLSQLKSALTSHGLNRKSTSKKDRKQFKKGGARETDRAKTLARLESIKKSLNKFDELQTKTKHDVGGRNIKGVVGRPSASKQAGLDQRRKTLLPEHQLRGHRGTFRDRRFGESDPTMSIEDRMLERYTRERQRGQGRKGMFNLEDDEEELFDDMEEGTALGGLTHGGRSISDLHGDDFEEQGLGSDEEDEEDEANPQKRARAALGFQKDDEEDDEPERKKSKAEVMSEIIAKSKSHKLERQQQREIDSDLRDELDQDIDGLRELLKQDDDNAEAGPSRRPTIPKPQEGADTDYDQFVRSLAFEARAKPKDRTKTEVEIAAEEAENLQKAEAKRLRRMRGENDTDDEDGEKGVRSKSTRRGEGDDLDDDFVDDDEDGMFGHGLTREAIENMDMPSVDDSDDSDNEDGEDEESESQDGDEEDEDESDEDLEAASDMEDLDEESAPRSSGGAQPNGDENLVSRSSKKGTGKHKSKSARKEIPFTFTCPTTVEDLEEILDDLKESALPTVVHRIRACHHPSLAEGNKGKLQNFLGVLLDYVLVLASRPEPALHHISSLMPHITALVKLNPITAAHHFISKLALMQKNLTHGLALGAGNPQAKTLPGAPELVILRMIGLVWSTSDFSHPVAAPAALLMGQYLSQSKVRRLSDLASGLFLCSIVAQFESFSKRITPEAINFVAGAVTALLPQRKGASRSPSYPSLGVSDLRVYVRQPSTLDVHEQADFTRSLTAQDEEEQVQVNLVGTALRLVDTIAGLQAGSPAFIELFSPIQSILESCKVGKMSQSVQSLHAKTLKSLKRMLNLAITSRQPLALQAHKPIPIASFAPRFEDDFAPGRHYDPDVERNSAKKVKTLYKKERSGAIRELRKDNRFLAGEKAREQAEKDESYNARMRKVEGSLNSERAEEKQMQREKAREKRRRG